MAEVKALVRGGVTICATIHSPTPYAFSLFDSLMILLRGRVVYFGDRGADPRADTTPDGTLGPYNQPRHSVSCSPSPYMTLGTLLSACPLPFSSLRLPIC